jgi:hypothetical protein
MIDSAMKVKLQNDLGNIEKSRDKVDFSFRLCLCCGHDEVPFVVNYSLPGLGEEDYWPGVHGVPYLGPVLVLC